MDWTDATGYCLLWLNMQKVWQRQLFMSAVKLIWALCNSKININFDLLLAYFAGLPLQQLQKMHNKELVLQVCKQVYKSVSDKVWHTLRAYSLTVHCWFMGRTFKFRILLSIWIKAFFCLEAARELCFNCVILKFVILRFFWNTFIIILKILGCGYPARSFSFLCQPILVQNFIILR